MKYQKALGDPATKSGKNKDFSQIKDVDNSFLAIDDIEIGYKAKIPLWMFGFLY